MSKRKNPAPSSPDTPHVAGSPRCDDPQRVGQEEGVGAFIDEAATITRDQLDGLPSPKPGQVLHLDGIFPRDPGKPIPCPTCNPDGRSATGGWLKGGG